MKKTLIALSLCTAFALLAQTGSNWIYGYAGNKASWWKLDMAAFTINGDTLSVKAPAIPPASQRIIGAKLTHDAVSAGWKIPPTAKPATIEVWVNGLHYWPVVDYVISNNVVQPVGANMLPEYDVRINYEQ